MKIWLVETGEPLPIKSGVRKLRGAILADKLVERGHEVLWWTSAFDHQRKEFISDKERNYSISEKYTIRVLRGLSYRKNVSLMRYIGNQIIALKFRIQSKKYPKPDIIIAVVPDHLLAYEATRYAQKKNIPSIVDVLDRWPDIFLERFKNAVLYKLGRTILLFDYLRLSFLFRNTTSLLAVSETYLKWAVNKFNRKQNKFDKVVYLGYKALAEETPEQNNATHPVWREQIRNKKIILFLGTFGVSYDLELATKAASYFEKSGRNDICFVLAGTGEKFEPTQNQTADLNNVVLTGWINKNEIEILLRNAFAGLLLYTKDAPQSLPFKPFEYLSAGLPLINSLDGEMAALTEKYRLGLNYKAGVLEELCDCIKRLVEEPDLHGEFAQSALKFFKKFGDADNIYSEYANHVENVFAERKE